MGASRRQRHIKINAICTDEKTRCVKLVSVGACLVKCIQLSGVVPEDNHSVASNFLGGRGCGSVFRKLFCCGKTKANKQDPLILPPKVDGTQRERILQFLKLKKTPANARSISIRDQPLLRTESDEGSIYETLETVRSKQTKGKIARLGEAKLQPKNASRTKFAARCAAFLKKFKGRKCFLSTIPRRVTLYLKKLKENNSVTMSFQEIEKTDFDLIEQLFRAHSGDSTIEDPVLKELSHLVPDIVRYLKHPTNRKKVLGEIYKKAKENPALCSAITEFRGWDTESGKSLVGDIWAAEIFNAHLFLRNERSTTERAPGEIDCFVNSSTNLEDLMEGSIVLLQENCMYEPVFIPPGGNLPERLDGTRRIAWQYEPRVAIFRNNGTQKFFPWCNFRSPPDNSTLVRIKYRMYRNLMA